MSYILGVINEESKMKFISRSEEMILLAVWRLGANAYGVTIRNELKEMSGKTWAFGALFVMLERLSKKGLLDSYLTEPTRERGGRSKRIYKLTPEAIDALKEVRKLQESIWEGMPELSAGDLI
jgi:PadR family transcriptional regulator PadR